MNVKTFEIPYFNRKKIFTGLKEKHKETKKRKINGFDNLTMKIWKVWMLQDFSPLDHPPHAVARNTNVNIFLKNVWTILFPLTTNFCCFFRRHAYLEINIYFKKHCKDFIIHSLFRENKLNWMKSPKKARFCMYINNWNESSQNDWFLIVKKMLHFRALLSVIKLQIKFGFYDYVNLSMAYCLKLGIEQHFVVVLHSELIHGLQY